MKVYFTNLLFFSTRRQSPYFKSVHVTLQTETSTFSFCQSHSPFQSICVSLLIDGTGQNNSTRKFWLFTPILNVVWHFPSCLIMTSGWWSQAHGFFERTDYRLGSPWPLEILPLFFMREDGPQKWGNEGYQTDSTKTWTSIHPSLCRTWLCAL
jgi:hypothetical protein